MDSTHTVRWRMCDSSFNSRGRRSLYDSLWEMEYRSWLPHTILSACLLAFPPVCYRFFKELKNFRRIQTVLILPVQRESMDAFEITWERLMRASGIKYVVVATGDEKVAEECRMFGADCILTSKSYTNGIDRCIDALPKLRNYNVVVNVEGDGILIEPNIIDEIAWVLTDAPAFDGVRCIDLKVLEKGYEMKAVTVDTSDASQDSENKPTFQKLFKKKSD